MKTSPRLKQPGLKANDNHPQREQHVDAVLQTQAGDLPKRQGKVRDLYDLGDRLVLVATDRLSAFDWVLPTGIPDKGKILTALSLFWFERLGTPHHVLSDRLDEMGPAFAQRPEWFAGRSLLCRKTQVIPFECVVRGYLVGSGWKEYQANGQVCGVPLPAGLTEAARLPEPIFTPATKAATGHDENVSAAVMAQTLGASLTAELARRSLALYQQAHAHAASRGLILADTKFEFGQTASGELLLIDEVLTPDSSRFWPAAQYQPGRNPPSFDKQFVRDWLDRVGFDRQSVPPVLPPAIVAQTREKYREAYRLLTGLPWPTL